MRQRLWGNWYYWKDRCMKTSAYFLRTFFLISLYNNHHHYYHHFPFCHSFLQLFLFFFSRVCYLSFFLRIFAFLFSPLLLPVLILLLLLLLYLLFVIILSIFLIFFFMLSHYYKLFLSFYSVDFPVLRNAPGVTLIVSLCSNICPLKYTFILFSCQ